MKKSYLVILIILFFVILTLSNSNILPTKTEITELDIANVIGLDIYNEKYEMTVVRNNSQEGVGNSSGSGESQGETISIVDDSYIADLLASQTLSDKYINVSHARYYVVGEDSIDADFEHIIDYLSRNYQTRIDAKIIIVKGNTAKEFLQKVAKESYKLSDKLDNMEQDFESRSISKSLKIFEAVDILLRKNMDGVLPVIELVDKKEVDVSENTTNYNEPFDFGGLVVLKDAKVAGYLDKDETKAYNYVMNEVEDFFIYCEDEYAEIFFGMKDLKTSIEFEIEENKIDKVIFNTKFKSSFEEVKSNIDIFTEENTNRYEQMQEKIVEERIRKLVEKSFNIDVDYLMLEDSLHRQHPYKYAKLKENAWEDIKKADIEINVESSLKTTFNIIQTNKNQEENK